MYGLDDDADLEGEPFGLSGFDFDAAFAELAPEEQAEIERYVNSIRRPLQSGDPRRHHFVPQRYQRRFARDDKICRVSFDEPERIDELKTIDNAVVKDLYTIIDKEIGETVVVERLLATIDAAAGAPMDRLILGVLFPPQTKDRMDLAMFIAMLYVRGPHHRRKTEALADMIHKAPWQGIRTRAEMRERLGWMNDGAGPTEDELCQAFDMVQHLDEWEVVPHQNDHIRLMLELAVGLAPYLLNRYWSICRLPVPGLFTSDSPIIRYQKPQSRVAGYGVGIGNADEIWLPLDRQTVLMLHSEEIIGERIIPADDEYGIDQFNQMTVNHAVDEVYFHPDDRHRLTKVDLQPRDRPVSLVNGGGGIGLLTDGINGSPSRRKAHRYRSDRSR